MVLANSRHFLHNARLLAVFLPFLMLPVKSHAQNVYVSNGLNHAVYDFDSNGNLVSTFALPAASNPEGLAIDSSGNVFVAEDSNETVAKISTDGTITTVQSPFFNPDGLAFDRQGDLFISNVSQTAIEELTPQGQATYFSKSIPGVSGFFGLAFDGNGFLYAADFNDGEIYKFSPSGMGTLFASGLTSPVGIAVDQNNDLFVSSYFGGTITKITPSGAESTFATGGSQPFGLAFDSQQDLFVVNHAGQLPLTEFGAGGSRQLLGQALGGDPNFIAVTVPEPTSVAWLLMALPMVCRFHRGMPSHRPLQTETA